MNSAEELMENLQQLLSNMLGDHHDQQEYLNSWGVLPHYNMLVKLQEKRANSQIDWHSLPMSQAESMLVYYSGIYLYNKVYRTCGLNDKKATQLAEESVCNFEVDMWGKQ